jgi:uncharacterized membrane protein YphA (DoxX/SURF4 family)
MTPDRRRALLSSAALAGRFFVGAALAWSGYMKLLSPAEELAWTMESYRLLPAAATLPLARVLPWAELFVGASLFVGFLTRWSAAAAAALSLTFVGALASVLLRGIDLAGCGCFGRGGPQMTPLQALSLDVAMVLLCVLVFRFGARRASLDAWVEKPAPPRSAS